MTMLESDTQSQERAENLPLVEGNTGVSSLVDARNLSRGAELASSAGLDLKLEAFHVELRLANVTLVDRNVLHADEVLASGDAVLDLPLNAVLLPARPGCVNAGGAGVRQAGFHDLDPVAGAIVALDGTGGLGDVDHCGARMLDLLAERELEADRLASLDGVGGSVTGDGSLVAAELRAVDDLGSERGHVAVGVLAGIGIVAADGLVVDDQLVHDVMRLSDGRKKREDSSCLDHFEEMEERIETNGSGMQKRRNGIEVSGTG
jgi:hypothetical protein